MQPSPTKNNRNNLKIKQPMKSIQAAESYQNQFIYFEKHGTKSDLKNEIFLKTSR